MAAEEQRFADTVCKLNACHLDGYGTEISQQAQHVVLNRRVPLSPRSKSHPFQRAATLGTVPFSTLPGAGEPSFSTWAMAQDAKQQHSAPMSIIEGRSKSDRMRHGSTEALAMLRASSATSDTLTATFDGQPSPPCSSSCASLSATLDTASPDRSHGGNLLSNSFGTGMQHSGTHSSGAHSGAPQPMASPGSIRIVTATSNESVAEIMERAQSLANKLQEVDAVSPTTTNNSQQSSFETAPVFQENWEGRVHKGLPRVRSTPALLYKSHSGSFGNDLLRMVGVPTCPKTPDGRMGMSGGMMSGGMMSGGMMSGGMSGRSGMLDMALHEHEEEEAEGQDV